MHTERPMQQGLFHFCLTLISTRYQTSIHNCCKRASIREGFAHVLFCSCRGIIDPFYEGDICHASVRCVPITLNCVAEGTLVDLAFSFRLGNSHTIHYFPQAALEKTTVDSVTCMVTRPRVDDYTVTTLKRDSNRSDPNLSLSVLPCALRACALRALPCALRANSLCDKMRKEAVLLRRAPTRILSASILLARAIAILFARIGFRRLACVFLNCAEVVGNLP